VLDMVLLGATVAVVLLVIALFALLMPSIARAQERAQEYVGRLGGACWPATSSIARWWRPCASLGRLPPPPPGNGQ
jgi:ATP-binding cassette subfamily B protein